MTVVIVSPKAEFDVRMILETLHQNAGAAVRDRYLMLFEQIYRSMTDFPGLGAPRPSYGADIRIRHVSPYVIWYDHVEENDEITILRVVHGSRKITPDLLRS